MKNRMLFTFAVLACMAAPAFGQSSVVCESDGSYRECRLEGPGVGTLVRQMSDAACIEGKTWGYRDGRIWVDRGCRAEFAAGRDRLLSSSTLPALATQSLVCESRDNRRAHCRADTNLGVILARQLSDSPCRLNRTWGFDENGVWVTSGCRAEFLTPDNRMGTTPMVSSSRTGAPIVVCESENNGHKHCRADTRFGVSIHRQLSDTRCERNRSWGVDDLGIWVTNGCRAEFVLERR